MRHADADFRSCRPRTARRHPRGLSQLFVALLWLAPLASRATLAEDGTVVQHIASVDGGVEAAIDAPWRLEPDYAKSPIYPTIPIVVSIHDTVLQSDPETAAALGRICEMTIHEEGAPTAPGMEYTEQFPAGRFTEIERSDKWPNGTEAARNHHLCRLWAGETCSDFDLDVGASAEWHGTVHYTPRQQTPGADVQLTVQVRVARAGQPCSEPKPFLARGAGLFDRLGPDPSFSPSFVIVNRLIVHLGEEPLPRFGGDWVYGDVHYHSQGTDNEGESAIAYRPTLQAMRAIGLDFAFGTEHASAGSSGQITDVDEIFVDNVPDSWFVPDFLEDDVDEFVRDLKIRIGAQTRAEAARDMNATRFAAMRAVLNDAPGSNPFFPTGANAEVMKVPGRGGAARLFLGGEVDVIPEMSAAEQASGLFGYGNGLAYYWRNACSEYPDFLNQAQDWTTMTICSGPDELGDEPTFEGGRYKIQDVQAFGDPSYYARQHLVHLPVDGTRDDAFVASDTSIWGGATRRLGPAFARPGEEAFVDGVLYRDYELGRKGYAFLAHPVDAASGRGTGRLGPDIVPYSDVQLETAFSSPWVLGLQLWNEDSRLSSGGQGSDSISGFPLQYFDGLLGKFVWAKWRGLNPNPAYSDLHHGLFAWDKMLLWGMRSSRTAGLSWLPAGEPRRVFMAGGSDAHGDLNYRREGRLGGVTGIVDTAIGKPRNLLYVGPTRPESVTDADGAEHGAVGQGQVTAALATGNFAITDGPALRIALDANLNGVIDAGDVPMGGVVHTPYKGAYAPFLVEWKSTDEFGPVAGIDLYVGAASDALDDGLVYAPAGHGVHAYPFFGEVNPTAWVDATGGTHHELKDGYLLDPSGRLHITPTAGEAKAGIRRVYLRADDFVVGRRRVNQPEQTCEYKCVNNGRYCQMKCSTPPPTYHFDSVTAPDRIYVRAFARTAREAGAICNQAPQDNGQAIAQRSGQCIERLAFTNPIWVDNLVAPPPPGDFSVTCSPPSVNVFYPGTGSITCTVQSTGGFARAVSLTCDGLPQGASCTDTTVTPPANGSLDIVMSVSATPSTPFVTSTYRVRGTSRDDLSGLDVVRTSADLTLVVGNPNPAPPAPPVTGPIAEWDWQFGAPSCYGVVASCDTDTAVINRGRFEPNTPNTLGGICDDGWTTGAGAVKRIRVATVDGSPFAARALVRVDAVVIASTRPLTEAVDIFVAPDASAPVWYRVATMVPQWALSQTLTATFELPPGNRHAVRVQFRTGVDGGDCTVGSHNDRDDLVLGGTP